jgi:hypothetical protein
MIYIRIAALLSLNPSSKDYYSAKFIKLPYSKLRRMGKFYTLLIVALFTLNSPQLFAQTTIVTDTVVPTSTCPGGFLLIPFTVTNPNFNPGNVFYAEWSNAFGDFSNPDTVGSIPFIFGGRGVIFASIPQDAGFGLLYRVRVVASDPQIVGSQSPLPIFVTAVNLSATIEADPSSPQCEGNDVTLSAQVTIPLGATYAWNSGGTDGSIVVNQPGPYSVTVTSFGCDVVSDPFNLAMLAVPPRPDIQTLPGGVFQGPPQAGYQWHFNGSPISGATDSTYLPTHSGIYNLVTYSDDGCPSALSAPILRIKSEGTIAGQQIVPYRDTVTGWYPVELASDTSIVDPIPTSTNYSVRVYPNPASDYLIVETNTLKEEKIFFILYDVSGSTVYSSPRTTVNGYYKHEVDMSGLAAGMYNMQLFVRGHLQSRNIQKR